MHMPVAHRSPIDADASESAEPVALSVSGLVRALAGDELRRVFAVRFALGASEARVLTLLAMRAPFSLSKPVLRDLLVAVDGLVLTPAGLDQVLRNIAAALWRAGCVGEVLHPVPGGWRICGNGQAMLISLIEGPA